jgi:hypothetical protein
LTAHARQRQRTWRTNYPPAAGEIGQADFPGPDVQVKISIEKRRGYPDQNRIELKTFRVMGLCPT